jgi:hypothetical protein
MATSLRTVISVSRSSAIPLASVRPSSSEIWAIGRIEARRMQLHPSFLVGMAFGLFILRGAVGASPGGGTLIENVRWLMLGALVGLLLGSILSTNIAALRARRSGVQELFGALPAPPETLTAGLLTGVLVGPVMLATVLTALGWLVFRSDPDIGPYLDLFLAVQIPLTVAALGALGIAIGRWIPSLFGGPMVIVAHIFTPLLWAVPWILLSSSGTSSTWWPRSRRGSCSRSLAIDARSGVSRSRLARCRSASLPRSNRCPKVAGSDRHDRRSSDPRSAARSAECQNDPMGRVRRHRMARGARRVDGRPQG